MTPENEFVFSRNQIIKAMVIGPLLLFISVFLIGFAALGIWGI